MLKTKRYILKWRDKRKANEEEDKEEEGDEKGSWKYHMI